MFRRAMLTSTLRDLLGEHGPLADRVLEEVRADRGRLPVVFPGLPRRTARAPVGGGRREFGDAVVDLDAFRVCDLVAGLGAGVARQVLQHLALALSHTDAHLRLALNSRPSKRRRLQQAVDKSGVTRPGAPRGLLLGRGDL